MAMFVDKVRIEFWKLEELNEKMTCVFVPAWYHGKGDAEYTVI